MRKTRRRDSARPAARRKDFNSAQSGQASAGAGEGPSRISLLRHKVEALRLRALAALQSGDLRTKSWLDAEVAQLNATILRAETVVSRLIK